jgi:hypothetical protein
MVYGDFNFGRLWAVAGAADKRTYLRRTVCFPAIAKVAQCTNMT